MAKKRTILYTLILLSSALFTNCKKDAGPGGLATIKGKIYGIDVTSSGEVKGEGYIGDVKVYISVAGDPTYFDDVRTSYDGSYTFDFLRKGQYDIWVYSDCDTCAWKQKYELKSVEVTERKQTLELEDFHIIF